MILHRSISMVYGSSSSFVSGKGRAIELTSRKSELMERPHVPLRSVRPSSSYQNMSFTHSPTPPTTALLHATNTDREKTIFLSPNSRVLLPNPPHDPAFTQHVNAIKKKQSCRCKAPNNPPARPSH